MDAEGEYMDGDVALHMPRSVSEVSTDNGVILWRVEITQKTSGNMRSQVRAMQYYAIASNSWVACELSVAKHESLYCNSKITCIRITSPRENVLFDKEL